MNETIITPPPPPPQPQKPSKGHGCFQGCFIALAIIGGGTIMLFLLPFILLISVGTSINSTFSNFKSEIRSIRPSPEDAYASLEEIWVSGSDNDDCKAVRIPMRGMIMLGNSGSGWRSSDEDNADAALRAIRRATVDENVKAILLEVDSGGGGITASDVIYNALLRFKSEGRYIVVHMGDVAASGAYYISLPADRILAHPTTITGSIGVLISSYNLRELASKIGVRDVTIKSGENKDMLNPFKDLTPEQEKLLQTLVDQMYERFVGLVAKHRGIKLERAKEIADGRIYLAPQAKEIGLIDSIGYTDDALNVVRELCGTDHVKFIRYSQNVSLMSLLRSPGFWGSVISEAMPKADQTSTFQLQ